MADTELTTIDGFVVVCLLTYNACMCVYMSSKWLPYSPFLFFFYSNNIVILTAMIMIICIIISLSLIGY